MTIGSSLVFEGETLAILAGVMFTIIFGLYTVVRRINHISSKYRWSAPSIWAALYTGCVLALINGAYIVGYVARLHWQTPDLAVMIGAVVVGIACIPAAALASNHYWLKLPARRELLQGTDPTEDSTPDQS